MSDILYQALVAGFVAVILSGVYSIYQFVKKKLSGEKQSADCTPPDTVSSAPPTSNIGVKSMKFHKFVHYIFIPFRFLVLAYSLSTALINIHLYLPIDIIFVLLPALIAIGLLVATFIGFFSFSKYSLYTLYAYFISITIGPVYYVVLALLYIPEEVSHWSANLFGSLVVTVIISIYYWKRKDLFLHNM